ncbi:hypothetical protein CPB84DRAFT_1795095 [Gymnopilus junonius]|uniref:Uncharacterized protein n=1 Tax=Gymnopilus junonius TaxID=109634 RepID=A0A9P5TGA8_GYMJU|nr:hypothetical protein CPB84DRAFT_1795095 [Gymnopilus junonius]
MSFVDGPFRVFFSFLFFLPNFFLPRFLFSFISDSSETRIHFISVPLICAFTFTFHFPLFTGRFDSVMASV